ncbi:uncharacterized protein LOC126633895 [Malus sylvestris]|uniref:uncharacterized protein LOC126633895 n=1 Tax=Malus sylvestris TaxID=3752 RepID=UPI0021AC2F0A|nr:uncharacterized protein LOC126633895 [Malus sylvestris]
MKRRKKKKLGEERGRSSPDGAAKDFRMLLRCGHMKMPVEDNEEAADPQAATFLKVSFMWLAHEKEISDKNLVKKVKKLSNVVEELRKVVKEKLVEENTKEEDEGKKDVGEEVEDERKDEEDGEEEKDEEDK